MAWFPTNIGVIDQVYSSSPRFRCIYQWFRGNPNVEAALAEADDPVLDVGAGAHPIPEATMIVDRYLSDTGHRTGSITTPKPLVKGDIEHLPFKDNSFEFVHARQVVEHASSAPDAIDELKRVGKHGYIECPSPMLERFCGGMCVSGHHKWVLADADGDIEAIPADEFEYQEYGPIPDRIFAFTPLKVVLLIINRYYRFLHTTHHW